MNMNELSVTLHLVALSCYNDKVVDALQVKDWDTIIDQNKKMIELFQGLNKVLARK